LTKALSTELAVSDTPRDRKGERAECTRVFDRADLAEEPEKYFLERVLDVVLGARERAGEHGSDERDVATPEVARGAWVSSHDGRDELGVGRKGGRRRIGALHDDASR
jgi:hypothetical protein